jgi:hypothetical protein
LSAAARIRTVGVAALLTLALTGCAGPAARPTPASTGAAQAALCRDALRQIDAAVQTAAVSDAEAYHVPGFPYLRSSRFLASFSERDLAPEAFEAWVERLEALDRDGRTVELMNLDALAKVRLDQQIAADTWPGWGTGDVIARCPMVLRAYDFAEEEGHDALRAAVAVPDDYSQLTRALGLYPLSAIPIALGYERWQAENLPAFEVSFGGEVWQGSPTLFTPAAGPSTAAPAEIARIIERSRANPLDIPEPSAADLEILARAFAPAFLVDVASDADRIGHPYWTESGLPDVDPGRPVAFVRLAHAWFEGRPVAQIVYLIWFEARPKQGTLDILGGRLDGLIWRVTIGNDGRPLVYDTIHPCGCYHLFFPAPGTRRLPLPQDAASDIRETVLVPQGAPPLIEGERLVVRLQSVSHFVTGLAPGSALGHEVAEQDYRLLVGNPLPDEVLRSMPRPQGGRRSLYGPEGLVERTERLERFILWPMGIASAGAMRQWGNHATAFVGHRHFDDPFLLQEAFAR